MTSTPGISEDDALLAELSSFVNRVTGVDMRCLRVCAKVLDATAASPSKVVVSFPPDAEFGIDEATFICHLEARVTFEREGKIIAEVEVEHALLHSLKPAEVPSRECMRRYIQNNARFMIYPYQREAIQSAVSRIGMGNLVLGLMQRDRPPVLSLELDVLDTDAAAESSEPEEGAKAAACD